MEEDVKGGFSRFVDWILGMDVLQRVSVVVVALSLVSVVANVWMAMAGDADFLRDKASNAAAIEDLRQQIAAVQSQETHSAEEVTDYLGRANKAGEEIAKLQNKAMKDYANDIRDPMAEYIDVDDNLHLGSWILGIDKGTSYTWRFCQCYDFDGTNVPMLWQAVLDDGTIIAYATATWNASDGLAHDIQAKLTGAGAAYLGAETSSANVDAPGPEDVVEDSDPAAASETVANASEEVSNEG